jgi:four helix bundle protein
VFCRFDRWSKSGVWAALFQVLKVQPDAIQIISQMPPGNADLSDQLKRAPMSISQNIGEGTGKRTPADCRKFFDIARGSAMECGVHLDICATLGLVQMELIERGKVLLEREVSMLTRLSHGQGQASAKAKVRGHGKASSPRPGKGQGPRQSV